MGRTFFDVISLKELFSAESSFGVRFGFTGIPSHFLFTLFFALSATKFIFILILTESIH